MMTESVPATPSPKAKASVDAGKKALKRFQKRKSRSPRASPPSANRSPASVAAPPTAASTSAAQAQALPPPPPQLGSREPATPKAVAQAKAQPVPSSPLWQQTPPGRIPAVRPTGLAQALPPLAAAAAGANAMLPKLAPAPGAGPAVSTPEAPLPAAAWVPDEKSGPTTAAVAAGSGGSGGSGGIGLTGDDVLSAGLLFGRTPKSFGTAGSTTQLLGASGRTGFAPSPLTPQVFTQNPPTPTYTPPQKPPTPTYTPPPTPPATTSQLSAASSAVPAAPATPGVAKRSTVSPIASPIASPITSLADGQEKFKQLQRAVDALVAEKRTMMTKMKTLQTERDNAVKTETEATDRVSKNLDRLMQLESKLLAAESSTQVLEDQLKESQAATVAAQQQIDSLRDVQLESTELKSRLEAKLSMQQSPPSGQASTETELLNEKLSAKLLETTRGLDQLKSEKEILLERWRSSSEQVKIAQTTAKNAETRLQEFAQQNGTLSKQLAAAIADAEQAKTNVAETIDALEAQVTALTEEAVSTQAKLDETTYALASEKVLRETAETIQLDTQQRYEEASGEKILILGGQQRLLEKARADTELISRATSQNKSLKLRLVELEDRFLEITNQKMELMLELDSARHQAQETRRLSAVALHPSPALTALTRPPAPLPQGEAAPGPEPAEIDALRREHGAMAEQLAALHKQVADGTSAAPVVSPAPTEPAAAGSDAFEDERSLLIAENENLWLEKEEHALEVESLRKQLEFVAAEAAEAEKKVEGQAIAPKAEDLVDSLYMQIHQLELERGHFMDETRKLETERDALLTVSKATEQAREKAAADGSRKPAPDTAVLDGEAKLESAETLSSGTALPPLPDGSSPPPSMVQEMRYAQIEAELSYMTDERDELRARLEYMTDMNSDLNRRLKVEQELTTQLAQETEQIGDYISLYHQQRQEMNRRLAEKDRIIESARRGFGGGGGRGDAAVVSEAGAGDAGTAIPADVTMEDVFVDEYADLSFLDESIPFFMQTDSSFMEI